LRATAFVAGAAGIVGLVTGTLCWSVAKSRHSDAVSYWNQGTNDAKAQSLQGQAKNYETAANISLIGGGALVALGGVLYFIGRPGPQPDLPGTHAHVMPAVGPGFAGINAGRTW
jgi:hypothetical protein